jgi:hypothetical protein
MKRAEKAAALEQRISWTKMHWVPFFSDMPFRTMRLGCLRTPFAIIARAAENSARFSELGVSETNTTPGKRVHGPDSRLTALDERAKRLLEIVALSHARNQPLTVLAAMAWMPSAGTRLMHRKLHLLRTLGGIKKAMTAVKAWVLSLLRKSIAA